MKGNVSGIYTITDMTNGEKYVGQSVDIRDRWYSHRRLLRLGQHHSPKLQMAWDAHGQDAFTFEVIELAEAARLDEREDHWVRELLPALNWRRSLNGVQRGWHHSEETRKKITAANKGRKGRPLTEAEKQHLRDFAKANPYRHSPEILARIAESRKGYRHGPDALAKMRAAMAGRKLSEKHKANIAAARRGLKRPPEVIAAVTEGRKRAFEAKRALGLPCWKNSVPRSDKKLTQEQETQMRALYVPGGNRWAKRGPTIKELGAKFGVSYLTAWKTLKRAA